MVKKLRATGIFLSVSATACSPDVTSRFQRPLLDASVSSSGSIDASPEPLRVSWNHPDYSVSFTLPDTAVATAKPERVCHPSQVPVRPTFPSSEEACEIFGEISLDHRLVCDGEFWRTIPVWLSVHSFAQGAPFVEDYGSIYRSGGQAEQPTARVYSLNLEPTPVPYLAVGEERFERALLTLTGGELEGTYQRAQRRRAPDGSVAIFPTPEQLRTTTLPSYGPYRFAEGSIEYQGATYQGVVVTSETPFFFSRYLPPFQDQPDSMYAKEAMVGHTSTRFFVNLSRGNLRFFLLDHDVGIHGSAAFASTYPSLMGDPNAVPRSIKTSVIIDQTSYPWMDEAYVHHLMASASEYLYTRTRFTYDITDVRSVPEVLSPFDRELQDARFEFFRSLYENAPQTPEFVLVLTNLASEGVDGKTFMFRLARETCNRFVSPYGEPLIYGGYAGADRPTLELVASTILHELNHSFYVGNGHSTGEECPARYDPLLLRFSMFLSDTMCPLSLETLRGSFCECP